MALSSAKDSQGSRKYNRHRRSYRSRSQGRTSKRASISGPAAAFEQFIANANGPATQIGSHRIKLPPEAQDIKAWRVAGLRIDPGAPGLSPEVIAQFGQQPQLRFILQPVTTLPGGGVKVDDVAAHVIFSFDLGGEAPAHAGCLPEPNPT